MLMFTVCRSRETWRAASGREQTDSTVTNMQGINRGGCLRERLKSAQAKMACQKHTHRQALKAIKRILHFIINSLHHYHQIRKVTSELWRPSLFDYKAFHTRSRLNEHGNHHRTIISQHESERKTCQNSYSCTGCD